MFFLLFSPSLSLSLSSFPMLCFSQIQKEKAKEVVVVVVAAGSSIPCGNHTHGCKVSLLSQFLSSFKGLSVFIFIFSFFLRVCQFLFLIPPFHFSSIHPSIHYSFLFNFCTICTHEESGLLLKVFRQKRKLLHWHHLRFLLISCFKYYFLYFFVCIYVYIVLIPPWLWMCSFLKKTPFSRF